MMSSALTSPTITVVDPSTGEPGATFAVDSADNLTTSREPISFRAAPGGAGRGP
jgi:hypothetical protein